MRRRRLAAELQRLRAASQRTLEEVAAYLLECSTGQDQPDRGTGRWPSASRTAQRPAGALRRHRGSP